MAIHNPAGLYSGGDVQVDSSPATNFYLQSRMKERAKADAFNSYINDLAKTLTPTGMAANDVNDFLAKKNAWQQDWVDNKKILSNPRDPNYGEALTRNKFLYNDALGHSAKSIDKVKNIGQIPNLNPEQRERLIKHSFEDMSSASLPLTDPNYKPFNQSMLEYNPKEFTLDDEAQLVTNLTKNKAREEQKIFGATNPKTYLRDVTTTGVYKPEDLQGMATQAASEYTSNKSYQHKIDKLFDDSYNPETGQVELPKAYNDVFKKVFNKDIHVPQELAAAYALNAIQQQQTKKEQAVDTFAQAKALEGIKQANRVDLLKKRQQLKDMSVKDQDVWSQQYLDAGVNEALANSGDSRTDFFAKPAIITDPLLSKAFEREGKEPDRIIFSEGQYKPIYYERQYKTGALVRKNKKGEDVTDKPDEQGDPVILERFSQPISKKQAQVLLLKVAPSSKQFVNEVTDDTPAEDDGGLGFQWDDK